MSDVLLAPIRDVVIDPPDGTWPVAVAYFQIGDELVLIDMCTPLEPR